MVVLLASVIGCTFTGTVVGLDIEGWDSGGGAKITCPRESDFCCLTLSSLTWPVARSVTKKSG